MVDTTSTFDLFWTYVLGDYDDYSDDEATAKPKDESREREQQGREEKSKIKSKPPSQVRPPNSRHQRTNWNKKRVRGWTRSRK
jgi:hypothetical protein